MSELSDEIPAISDAIAELTSRNGDARQQLEHFQAVIVELQRRGNSTELLRTIAHLESLRADIRMECANREQTAFRRVSSLLQRISLKSAETDCYVVGSNQGASLEVMIASDASCFVWNPSRSVIRLGVVDFWSKYRPIIKDLIADGKTARSTAQTETATTISNPQSPSKSTSVSEGEALLLSACCRESLRGESASWRAHAQHLGTTARFVCHVCEAEKLGRRNRTFDVAGLWMHFASLHRSAPGVPVTPPIVSAPNNPPRITGNSGEAGDQGPNPRPPSATPASSPSNRTEAETLEMLDELSTRFLNLAAADRIDFGRPRQQTCSSNSRRVHAPPRRCTAAEGSPRRACGADGQGRWTTYPRRTADEGLAVVFPAHPRTRERLERFGLLARLTDHPAVRLCEPLPYRENLSLMADAAVALTDSGGIQEESSYLRVPCLTLRANTERPVTVTHGTNTLVGDDLDRAWQLLREVMKGHGPQGGPIEGWDGHAAERVIDALTERWATR